MLCEQFTTVSVDKFASGGFRDAFVANGMKGVSGKMVLKRYKPERITELSHLFNSVDDHTRKVVQMYALARHFAQMMANEAPLEYGETFAYTKAESFAHYSYVKSGEQLIIVDLQGVGFTLFDPEIASTQLYDKDNSIYFFPVRNLNRAF